MLLGATRHWRCGGECYGEACRVSERPLQSYKSRGVVGAATAALQIVTAAEVVGYCCGVALVAVYGVVHVAHVFVGDAASQGF